MGNSKDNSIEKVPQPKSRDRQGKRKMNKKQHLMTGHQMKTSKTLVISRSNNTKNNEEVQFLSLTLVKYENNAHENENFLRIAGITRYINRTILILTNLGTHRAG